jgi:hypothetical protein
MRGPTILPGYVLFAVTLGGLVGAPSAYPNVVFTSGNNPQTGEQNILFGSADAGQTVSAETDQGIPVLFTSLTSQTLFQNAHGQAEIENNDDPGKLPLTSIEVSVPGHSVQSFILNLQNGTGTAHVEAIGTSNQTFDYLLGNGQNFFTISAFDGDSLSAIRISGSDTGGFGFDAIKQPRLSIAAVADTPGTTVATTLGSAVPIPEPSSVAVLGAGLLGLSFIATRRKRRSA